MSSAGSRFVVIINPISGTGGHPSVTRRRAERAAAILRLRGVEGQVSVSERPGHARELARTALSQGVTTVIAWGGDGTVNEVGSALVFTDTALAIVPSGSGNGLARELGIPADPDRAFEVALGECRRVIDAGELDGRLFFNIAGIGLDARITHRFTEDGLVRRGFKRYLAITFRELLTYEPVDQTIVADGELIHARTLLVAIANSRQYGNGAIIAPTAKMDDGKLDVVIVEHRPLWRTFMHLPRVFLGDVDRVPGVRIRSAAEIEVISSSHVLYHVDGEPGIGGVSLKARIHPGALNVRVAASAKRRAR